jgi:REP element-mobilizing transposase RayT
MYHVMSRGNRGKKVFQTDGERELWLETLGEAVYKTGWRVHAYVLMGNHYHFLLETPQANLVAGMKWLQGTFTQRINARRRKRGHLFQGRYRALIVEPEEKVYYMSIATYIHMNPVRAGMVGQEAKSLRAYPWSSYPGYLSRAKNRPPWLVVSRLLGAFGLEDRARDRNMYEYFMEEQILKWQTRRGKKVLEREWKEIRRGWFMGGEQFRTFLLERLDGVFEGKQRSSFSGEGARAHDEGEAEKLLDMSLTHLGLKEDDLKTMMKGAPEKVVIAWLIRKYTAASNRWIAGRLSMGQAGYVSALVKKARETKRGQIWKLKKKLESGFGKDGGHIAGFYNI